MALGLGLACGAAIDGEILLHDTQVGGSRRAVLVLPEVQRGMREGNLDTRSVEVHLDQAVVSAPHAPLIAGGCLDDDPNGYPVIAKGSDTGHIEGGKQLVAMLGIFLERFVGELELLNGFVDILAIGDVVFAQMIEIGSASCRE